MLSRWKSATVLRTQQHRLLRCLTAVNHWWKIWRYVCLESPWRWQRFKNAWCRLTKWRIRFIKNDPYLYDFSILPFWINCVALCCFCWNYILVVHLTRSISEKKRGKKSENGNGENLILRLGRNFSFLFSVSGFLSSKASSNKKKNSAAPSSLSICTKP